MNTSILTCKTYNRTITNIDELGCQIIQTAADLYYYDFGYICMGPLGLIIIISIFGRLKGHYRWFLLNQAIWDLAASYSYSCQNLMSYWVKQVPACLYLTNNKSNYTYIQFDLFIGNAISKNSYSALFLLSSFRFLSLYYPNASSKFFKGRKILYIIILFNLFVFLFDLYPLFFYFQTHKMNDLVDECMIKRNLTQSACLLLREYENDSLYTFYKNLTKGFELLQHFKPPLFLFLSMLATTAVIWKMAKQIVYQFKQDRKDFSNTARIAAVIGLQNIVNCFGVFIEVLNRFIPRSIEILKLKVRLSRYVDPAIDYTGYLDLRLPYWLDGSVGLSSDTCRSTIIQFRILIEAFIVLVIMTGYREAIMDFIKFIYKTIKKPSKFLENFKVKKTNVSIPSLF